MGPVSGLESAHPTECAADYMINEQTGVYSRGPVNERIWVTRLHQVLELQGLTILLRQVNPDL